MFPNKGNKHQAGSPVTKCSIFLEWSGGGQSVGVNKDGTEKAIPSQIVKGLE